MERTCNQHGLAVWSRDVTADDNTIQTEMTLRLLIPDGEPQTCIAVGGMAWYLTESDLRSLQTAIGWILPMIHAHTVKMGE